MPSFRPTLQLARLILLISLLGAITSSVRAQSERATTDPEAPEELSDQEANHRTLTETVLWYVPNRFVDAADMIRAKVRVGPGVSATARVTKPVSFFAGYHDAWYLGLPRWREKGTLPHLLGLDGIAGWSLGLYDRSTHDAEKDRGPMYGDFEIGAGVNLGFFGGDAGIDLAEMADFICGFALVDIRDDDL